MRFWKKAETELEREIAHHLHYLAAEYERQGHSREESLAMARREFGGAAQVKEQCRDERRFAWFAGFRHDIVFGLRMMRRTPAVTAAAVFSLALGIGANAAIASLMDAILWRTLPVPNAKQLRLVNWEGHGFPRELVNGGSGSMYPAGSVDIADFFSFSAYEEMRKSVAGRAWVAAYNDPSRVSVSYQGRALVAESRAVSGNFFTTVPAQPEMGRVIVEGDDHEAATPTVVVSHRFWATSLGSDPEAIGRTLSLNGRPYVIVGVLESGFYGLQPGDSTAMYVPMRLAPRGADGKEWLINNRLWGTQVIARLAPETEESRLRAEMDAVFRAGWSGKPNPRNVPRVRLDDGARGLGALSREFRSPLFVLGGLVTLLLVIACANIANLLLARGVARRKEITMRVSLGCSRARLMRQFLTESALIAILGAAGSLGVAYLTGNVLGQFVGGRNDLPLEVALDYRILGIVGAITAAAMAIFAVLPAWKGSRQLDASWLKQGSGSIGEGHRRKWTTGKTLVVAQMAMSVVLVMAAVIFTRNLRAIESSDPGFDRRNLVIFGIRPGTSGYEKSRLEQFYFDLEQRLAATPGVAGVGLTWMRPMNIGGWWEDMKLPGATEKYSVSMNGVTPSYLPLYTGRLIAGRNFTWADIRSEARVAIISEDLARKFGEASVLGRRIQSSEASPDQKDSVYEVVGIAPAIAATSMKDRPYAVWVPFKKDGADATVVMRTAQSPRVVLPAIRRAMGEIDRNLPMVDTITMEDQISKILRRERMFATLCGGFGVLAIALSVVGLYGVMAYNTSRRRSEIGLRLALGALPGDVLRMVLREGLATALIGVALGLPAVWFCAQYAEKELFKMKAIEPASLAAALGILVGAAVVAVAIPAARASAVQPSETLREQ